jgi:ribonuclease P/MRP protein subunit RPP1
MKVLEEQKKVIEEAEKSVGIEIVQGVEIKVESPQELKKIVDKVREKVVIVVVHGGDYQINRAACENPKVDILSHPERERNDCGLDEYCLRKAKENDVLIEINFSEILNVHRKARAHVLQNISENIRLCKEIGAKMVICSDAKSVWELRDPRALASIANILGMDLGKAIDCVTEIPEQLVERNKKILAGEIVVRGVELWQE